MERISRIVLASIVVLALVTEPGSADPPALGPFDRQVADHLARLSSDSPKERAGAAEALGYLRAYAAEGALVGRLDDDSPLVRREAAMALGWSGGRNAIPRLLGALDDDDWLTRQAAHVSLTNLTGMEFPFDSSASPDRRSVEAETWRNWWATVPEDRAPDDVLALVTAPGPTAWRVERGLRALGVLGGKEATEAIQKVLGEAPTTAPDDRPMVRAGIRSLGRLGDEAALEALTSYLQNTMWARCAAEALGDFGDPRAVAALLDVYPRYAKQLDGAYPAELPDDDNWGGPPSDVAEDRMLETPYWISYALCRLPLDTPEHRQTLRQLAPLIMANLPRDHDRAMLYEPGTPDLLTRHLITAAGLRQEACEHAFGLLGQPRRVPKPPDAPQWPKPPGYRSASTAEREAICASTWLPVLCTEPDDVPRLIALLSHEEGWVRMNAAKTLAWLGDPRAVEPIARRLARAKAEADYGYCGTFKFDEYSDPTPRWREAFVRALGLLGAREHTKLLVRILGDERSSLGIRYAAAQALSDLLAEGDNPEATAALTEAADGHAFESIRHLAQDTFRIRGMTLPTVPRPAPSELPERQTEHAPSQPGELEAVVFLKGGNLIPNDVGTVELADRWRRTYVYSDPGPT
ncbi:MAG: HEAT repeat domain-containing protein, partial [Planctomycetes bacterium]|nr:HEAT repeat domain-containing protein [Planctomycetota bacterium]